VTALLADLGRLSPAQLRDALADLDAAQLEALAYDWPTWARPEQRVPAGDWRTWLLLTGRGWGKTRTLSETVRTWAQARDARIAVVGRTSADVRDVLVEGPAGILSVHPPSERPTYLPTVRRIAWRSGAVATTYSAEEPDLLRGPSHTHAVADELAAWVRAEEAWSNLQLTLRLGVHPRIVAATTPRPIKLLRDLLTASSTVVTRGRTSDNAALAQSVLDEFRARYGGTRLGLQELEGEILWETPGALWSRDLLDRTRVQAAPELVRVVVGVDPAASANEGSDLTGIVACGRDRAGHVYVLADRSCRASPAGWAARAVALFDELRADRLVAEANQGGAMVEATLRTVRASLPIRLVHASRGKVTRAEPVAAVWEQGKAHVVGTFPDLETELCTFAPGTMERSPDRADAMVWAATELIGAGLVSADVFNLPRLPWRSRDPREVGLRW
jgi:phage terminase large subunit-like protein